MANELSYDEIEEKLAQTAATLLTTLLQLVRNRHAEDAETIAEIDALTECRLTISVVPSQAQIELVGNIEGGTKRFYGGTFEKIGMLH